MPYTELNARLVEEFGKLERLCSQIYSEKHGVTCYIEDMEHTYNDSIHIANWKRDLRRLKEIRHKRNNLSHGEVPFSAPCADQDDIDFVTNFRDRILNSSDSLSQYRRFSKSGLDAKSQSTSSLHTTTSNRSVEPPRQPLGCELWLGIIGVLFLAVLWIISRL